METKTVRRGGLALAFLGAFVLTSVVGCGSGRLPVAGTVTVDGQPLNDGQLVFTPDSSKGNTSRIVCTSWIKDGRYNLETNGVTRSESGSGVPPGWYKVSFRLLHEGGKKSKLQTVNVNGKFMDPDKTPLSVEVKNNPEPGAYDFKFTK